MIKRKSIIGTIVYFLILFSFFFAVQGKTEKMSDAFQCVILPSPVIAPRESHVVPGFLEAYRSGAGTSHDRITDHLGWVPSPTRAICTLARIDFEDIDDEHGEFTRCQILQNTSVGWDLEAEMQTGGGHTDANARCWGLCLTW